MAQKTTRTWGMVLSLGTPLAVVGVAAMAISYATLIDVARVNGMPLPELFPILVDVGTVACMIAAAQFRLRGLEGRWLAYTTFILLSGVSIVANASHAGRAADLTVTTPWAAAVLAATPPATLLAITHLVMMLVPDEKERVKLQAKRERALEQQARKSEPQHAEPAPVSRVAVSAPATAVVNRPAVAGEMPSGLPLRLVETSLSGGADSEDEVRGAVRARVLEHVGEVGKRPTGKEVGEWLGGKTPKTGQRFLKQMEDDGLFATGIQQEQVVALG